MRQTSLDAYSEIKENGLLSFLRFKVYDAVYKNGPLSMAEAAECLKMSSKSVSPRFAELEKQGVLTSVGKKVCSVSGRTVLSWKTTNNLPIKYEKPISEKCCACNGTGMIKTKQGKLF